MVLEPLDPVDTLVIEDKRDVREGDVGFLLAGAFRARLLLLDMVTRDDVQPICRGQTVIVLDNVAVKRRTRLCEAACE